MNAPETRNPAGGRGFAATLQAGADSRTANITGFADAMRSAGLVPPGAIEPGELHRFPGAGKRPGNRAGWCKLFSDLRGGCYGDWSTGLTGTWQARRERPFSPAERAAFARQAAEAREAAAAELIAKHAEAANRAALIWDKAQAAPAGHPYLIAKRVQPHGARIHGDALVLPVAAFTGELVSLQFIGPDGTKRLLAGGQKRECFIPVAGDMACPQRVVLAEGWATGATLAEDEPGALVLAAIDAGNLEPVALAARNRWPSAVLVIAGDDDRQTAGNPGATKARAAAIAAGALLALPQWPEGAPASLTDFNDLAAWLAGGAA